MERSSNQSDSIYIRVCSRKNISQFLVLRMIREIWIAETYTGRRDYVGGKKGKRQSKEEWLKAIPKYTKQQISKFELHGFLVRQ